MILLCRAVERDTYSGRGRGRITHPRHMGLSLKEQQKMKGKKKVTTVLKFLTYSPLNGLMQPLFGLCIASFTAIIDRDKAISG